MKKILKKLQAQGFTLDSSRRIGSGSLSISRTGRVQLPKSFFDKEFPDEPVLYYCPLFKKKTQTLALVFSAGAVQGPHFRKVSRFSEHSVKLSTKVLTCGYLEIGKLLANHGYEVNAKRCVLEIKFKSPALLLNLSSVLIKKEKKKA